MRLLALLALAALGVRADLPGLAEHQLIDAYEELVTRLTRQLPPRLEELPQRLVLFSAWYVASRTLWSALRGGRCACYEAPDVAQVPPALRGRICDVDREALATVAPFLLGRQLSEVIQEDMTPPEVWATVAKRAMRPERRIDIEVYV